MQPKNYLIEGFKYLQHHIINYEKREYSNFRISGRILIAQKPQLLIYTDNRGMETT